MRSSEAELINSLHHPVINHTQKSNWDLHVRLYGQAPVLLMDHGKLVLEQMRFSLLPAGGRISFTANTRLDDWDEQRGLTWAFQRPLWREAFLHRRCVVPVSEFLEPIYTGAFEGQMMAFFDADSPLLFIAGIYQDTIDTKTGEVSRGFSVITDFAHPFVRETGHHRTVITLSAEAALEWIEEGPIEGRWGIDFLMRHKTQPKLQTRAVRTMKNWQARVAPAKAKGEREDQIRASVEKARAAFLAGSDKTRNP